MVVSSRRKIVFLAIAAAGLLAGCGKRGQLEPPPGTAAPAPENATNGGAERGGVRAKNPPILPPKRDLFIDRLLD